MRIAVVSVNGKPLSPCYACESPQADQERGRYP